MSILSDFEDALREHHIANGTRFRGTAAIHPLDYEEFEKEYGMKPGGPPISTFKGTAIRVTNCAERGKGFILVPRPQPTRLPRDPPPVDALHAGPGPGHDLSNHPAGHPITSERTHMRQIHTHKHNPCNDEIDIIATDEPGAGGANHLYAVRINTDREKGLHETTHLSFQNGPIKEAGVNGITQEVLLAVVIDRLQGFQENGPYFCRENALALTKLEEAMHWLLHRTRQREERGVEGAHEK